jgi:hypothetical protein
MTVASGSLDQILEGFSRRLYRLEQAVSTPGNFGGGENEFEEIVLDDPDDDEDAVIITPTAPETPLNVSVTPGAHFDVIYADVEWEADPDPENEPALIYEIEVAEKLGPDLYDVGQIFRTAGTNFRVQPLEPDTDYGVRVTAMSRIGKFSEPTVWEDFNSGTDNTVPDQITGVEIARGATSAVVTFDPSANVDVIGGKGLYEVQIDTVNTFDGPNVQTIRTTSWVVAFQGIETEDDYYARVSAIDSSGNQGPWSTVAGPAAVGGVIEDMIVGAFSAAKITYGEMDGDRIAANTASIGILETSSLTSADITLAGGSFRAGSPPTTGLLINSQGIRLYQGGVQTITLDATTGAATFRGNITGGTIQIGTNFSVDAFGNMAANNGFFSGDIDASIITGSEIHGTWFKTALTGSVADPAIWMGDPAGGSTRKTMYFVTTNSTVGAGYMQMYSGSFEIRAPGAGNVYMIANNTTVTVGNTGELYCQGSIRAGTNVYGSTGSFSSLYLNGGTITLYYTAGGYNSFTVSNAGAVSAASLSSASSVSGNSLVLGGTTWINSSRQIVASTEVYAVFNVTSSGSLYVAASGGSAGSAVHANGINQLYRYTSSSRFKQDIKPFKDDKKNNAKPERIHALQLRTWNSRLHPDDLGGVDDPDERVYGLVAEEVAEVAPELVLLNGDGKPEGIRESVLVYHLLAEVQQLRKEVDALKSAA